MSLCARPCALCSWWNSWWKYRRPCLTLRYSGLWSSTSTFQFLVVEDQVLVFKVFSQDSVQQRRLPENAFLSGLWSRSLTLFLVEVFLVLSQVRVHLLLTLQLVLKNALMNLAKGFFALFPKIKKVRRSLRTRGRNCLRTPAHPRRRLSWRTPSSGCGSRMTNLASRTTGTDALSVLSGSHRLASRWCGTSPRMRREGFITGTGIRVSLRLSSLLFLLGEERDRQPRAVYKYWVGGLPSCDHAATCSSSSSSFTADMNQKDRCSCMYKAGIAGYFAPRAVFPSLVGRFRMLGILAGTNLKYSCSGMCKAGFLVFLHLTLCCLRCTGKLDFGRWRLFFSGPLYLAVTCSSCLPEEYRFAYFREMASGMFPVFSALLGSTADT